MAEAHRLLHQGRRLHHMLIVWCVCVILRRQCCQILPLKLHLLLRYQMEHFSILAPRSQTICEWSSSIVDDCVSHKKKWSRGAVNANRLSNQACWTTDGGVIMNRFDHFQHVTRLTLQLAAYILKQLPSEYDCKIDSDLFFQAITIASEPRENGNTDAGRVTAGTWSHAPDKVVPEINNNSLKWVEHCQKRAQLIPAKYDHDYDRVREQIEMGNTRVSREKASKGKRSFDLKFKRLHISLGLKRAFDNVSSKMPKARSKISWI